MRARTLALPLLPSLALGSAFLLVHPAEQEARGFTLTGDSLNPGQRDFRLFNNFEDPTANNNTSASAPKINYPGQVKAEMAVWKGVVEWGSTVHGTGLGDPTQNFVGNGGANFDAAWMGNAAGVGGTDDNITSTISSCGGGGTLAFTELPTSNGWRIRFCEENAWDDGPGGGGTFPPNTFDIQGVMAHEYGHALGLGHSTNTNATMFASGAPNSVTERSIIGDDSSGVQAIYGVASPTKVVICETLVDGSDLTIRGHFFDPTDNDIWLTPTAVTATGADPRVIVTGVPSTNSGREITIAIPAGAGPGDVMVKTPAVGGASVSNAFPVDMDLSLAGGNIVNASLCPFTAVSASPATIESLDPGTAQNVTITGFQLTGTTSLMWNSVPVDSASWTIVDDQTITLDAPLGVLGTNTIELSDGVDTQSVTVEIVEAATPKLQVGTGDPDFVVAAGGQMAVTIGGQVGTLHKIFASMSPLPSVHPLASFDMGNQFMDFKRRMQFVVGPDGWAQKGVNVNFNGASPVIFYAQSLDFTSGANPTFAVGNLQSFTITP